MEIWHTTSERKSKHSTIPISSNCICQNEKCPRGQNCYSRESLLLRVILMVSRGGWRFCRRKAGPGGERRSCVAPCSPERRAPNRPRASGSREREPGIIHCDTRPSPTRYVEVLNHCVLRRVGMPVSASALRDLTPLRRTGLCAIHGAFGFRRLRCTVRRSPFSNRRTGSGRSH